MSQNRFTNIRRTNSQYLTQFQMQLWHAFSFLEKEVLENSCSFISPASQSHMTLRKCNLGRFIRVTSALPWLWHPASFEPYISSLSLLRCSMDRQTPQVAAHAKYINSGFDSHSPPFFHCRHSPVSCLSLQTVEQIPQVSAQL